MDDLGPSLESKIALLTQQRAISPLARLAFEGSVGKGATHFGLYDRSRVDFGDDVRIAEQSVIPGERPISTSTASKPPLEFFRFQARDKLEDWEYLAGVKFRQDFDIAQRPSQGVADPSRAELFDTDRLRKDIAAGVGRNRKGASRQSSAGDISVARLDAMRRRGELAKRCLVSFWLAEKIVGEEIWPKDVAVYLKMDPRYVGPRFREALAVLAGYYRTTVTSTSRAGVQSHHQETDDVREAV